MCYNTLINEFEAVFESVIETDSVTGLYNNSKKSNTILANLVNENNKKKLIFNGKDNF